MNSNFGFNSNCNVVNTIARSETFASGNSLSGNTPAILSVVEPFAPGNDVTDILVKNNLASPSIVEFSAVDNDSADFFANVLSNLFSNPS